MKLLNKQFNTSQTSRERGFTLIETMLYIALFALVMVGAIISVYGILGTSARNQVKAMVQEEGSFMQGKVDWVLSGAESVSVSADGLIMTAVRFDGTTMTINISGPTEGNMSIDRGEGSKGLNNSNVTITCPTAGAVGCFVYNEGTGDGINPKSIEAKFTVNSRTSEGLPYSQDFSTIKYLRK